MALQQVLRAGSTPSDAPLAILTALSNASAHVKQLDALTQGLLRRKLRGSTAIGTAVGTFFKDILRDTAGSGVLAREVKEFVAEIASVLRQAASTDLARVSLNMTHNQSAWLRFLHHFADLALVTRADWSPPADFIVGNIGARVSRLFEEEIAKHSQSGASALAPTTVASARAAVAAALAGSRAPESSPTATAASLQFGSIKEGVIDAVNELLDELATSASSISERVNDMVPYEDTLLTVGSSATVLHFLLAAKARKPTVYVAERAPALDGHMTAKLLSAKLQTVCIPDAAVSAVMPRVHQVIIGVQAVCSDGSAIAQAGTYAVVIAARAAGIPVIVLTNALKFIPKCVSSPAEASSLALAHKTAPHEILPLAYLEAHPEVEAIAEAFEVIPSKVIDTIITNTLVVVPSDVARINNDLYGSE